VLFYHTDGLLSETESLQSMACVGPT